MWIISKALYESWPCSQEQEVESLEDTCSDGKQYAPLNGNPTQLAYLSPDKMTAFSRLSRYGMTFKPLTADRGEDLLMWFREDFLARTYPALEREQVLTVSDQECGATWRGLLAKYDPDTHSLKTAQCSLFADLTESYATLPRWGTMRNGELYPQPIPALRTSESESGYWLTPRASDTGKGEKQDTFLARMGDRTDRCAQSLAAQINNPKTWPTPTAHNAKETNAPSEAHRNEPTPTSLVGGHLNPMWVEGLMGWPDDWSSLNNISHVKMCFWLMGHNHECDTRSREVLRVLRLGHAEKEIQSAIGGKVDICEAAILLSELCKHSDKPNEARVFMESAEALETELRSLRLCQQVASPPYRPRHLKQLLREYPDTMQALSRLLAHYGKTAWQDGSWENAIPRVGAGIAARVDRLKAIGNGQVPIVAATAFKILAEAR